VHLDRYARHPSYRHGKVLLRAQRDRATTHVVISPDACFPVAHPLMRRSLAWGRFPDQ
jgi:hypothetical protein